ncbi:MAG: transposase [Candidatus Methanoperedens sp.]
MKKAYCFRIYPNKNQEVKLNRTLNTCRHLYNDALSERKRQAELNRLKRDFQVFPWGKTEWISYEDQANTLSSEKNSFQKEVYSQVLQNTLKRLDRSFKNFFNGFGYPRFKGRNRYDSFTYPQNGFEVEIEDGKEGKIIISKIGTMRIILHRDIEGRIKTCTIKKDVDQWYAIFTAEIKKTSEPVEIKNAIGVDVGLSSLLTLSNGEQIAPPEFLRKSEKKLAKEQISLSRKKIGSENGKKQRIKVARVHRKIRNQRKDFAHKTSRMLVNTYDLIAFENLNIRGMVQNHHLAKSIADAGWYQLQNFTAYKAEDAGKLAEFCIAKGTSQECNVCGNVEHLTLADRVFHCSRCGNIEDRDVNASINVLNRCTAVTAGIEACKSGLNRDIMKQEATLLVR